MWWLWLSPIMSQVKVIGTLASYFFFVFASYMPQGEGVMIKLNWSEAPDWAKYRAMDDSGAWAYYENKPILEVLGYDWHKWQEWMPENMEDRVQYVTFTEDDMRASLECRPE